MEYKNQLQKQNWAITISMFLILIAGVVTLYSTGLASGASNDLTNQISFIVIGLVFYFGLMFFNYSYLRFIPVQILNILAGFLPLILVLFLGTTRKGATRWFDLGFATLQPSEFSKICLIILFGFILTQLKKYPEWLKAVIAIGSAVVMGGLVFLQPNLSTAIIIISMSVLMFLAYSKQQIYWLVSFVAFGLYMLIFSGTVYLNLWSGLMVKLVSVTIDFLLLGMFIFIQFVAGVLKKELRLFLLSTFVAAILLVGSSSLIWNNILNNYQRERILTFLNPEEVDPGLKFQMEQSRVAIGSGLLFGRGFGHGTQSKLNFLPEQHTDFIFASYAEEFGFVGTIVLIGLYIFLILSIFWIALHTHDSFAFVICIGVASMFLLEVFINIGVNLTILPPTGVVLPLMSLGGSSMWAKLIALGLVQSVMIYSKEESKGIAFRL